MSDKVILTAGHCVTELPSSGNYNARVGIFNIQNPGTNLQTHRVAKSVVHPKYKGGVAPYDIALMFLATPIEHTEFASPVVLSTKQPTPGASILYGWGVTDDGKISNDLLTAKKEIITLEECDKNMTSIIGTHPLDTQEDTNVCTGGLPQGGLSACSGDSGGPLFQDGEQVGIVSWGITPCGFSNAPSVYVKTVTFNDWIEETIKANQ